MIYRQAHETDRALMSEQTDAFMHVDDIPAMDPQDAMSHVELEPPEYPHDMELSKTVRNFTGQTSTRILCQEVHKFISEEALRNMR